MMTNMFLFRELLGAIRAKSATYFSLAGLLLLLFLASVTVFFMISPSDVIRSTEGQPIEEIHIYLSPTLSSDTINQWYLDWRERDGVERINLIFAQELDGTATGKVFIIVPTVPEDSGAIATEFREISGVTEVIEVPRELAINSPSISLVIRISLLAILVIAIAASLFCFRRGFQELLTLFSGEIRMLRLSGIAERTVSVLVVALGLLIGLLSGLFLLAALYLFHQIALTNPDAFSLLSGLTNGLRILSVGMAALALGTVLGGLAGLLGASLLHRREFDALP